MQNSCGILFVSKPTKKIGLGLRADGNNPNTWSTIGGGIEEGESFLDCLNREIKEELGIDLSPKLIPIDDNKNYKTFISFVDSEFTPILNKEHSDFKWFDYSELPKNLHPGLNTTLTKPFVQKVLNKHLNETTTDASGSFVGSLSSPIHRSNIGDYIKEDLEFKSRANDQEKQREEYIKDLVDKVTKPPLKEVKLEDLQKLNEWDIENNTENINEFYNRLFEYYHEIESMKCPVFSNCTYTVFTLKNGETFQINFNSPIDSYIYTNYKGINIFSNTKEMFEILDKIMESVNIKENVIKKGDFIKLVESELGEAITTDSTGSYETPKAWAKSMSKKDWRHQSKTTFPGGKFVKVKEKCKKFPYCEEGDINALELWEDEELVKESIKELSKELGVSENLIRNIINNIK